MSNTQWNDDQNAPYRKAGSVYNLKPSGHPVVSQNEGIVIDPGCKVSVFERHSDGSWHGTQRIVRRCSTTHLESMCEILKERDITIVEWDANNRWLGC